MNSARAESKQNIHNLRWRLDYPPPPSLPNPREIVSINGSIIQILFPRCCTSLMAVMSSLTPGRRCRRHLIGATKCSGKGQACGSSSDGEKV